MTEPTLPEPLPSRGGAWARSPDGKLIAVELPAQTHDATLDAAAAVAEGIVAEASPALSTRRRPAKED